MVWVFFYSNAEQECNFLLPHHSRMEVPQLCYEEGSFKIIWPFQRKTPLILLPMLLLIVRHSKYYLNFKFAFKQRKKKKMLAYINEGSFPVFYENIRSCTSFRPLHIFRLCRSNLFVIRGWKNCQACRNVCKPHRFAIPQPWALTQSLCLFQWIIWNLQTFENV